MLLESKVLYCHAYHVVGTPSAHAEIELFISVFFCFVVGITGGSKRQN